MNQGQTKGPDPGITTEEPQRVYGPLNDEERKEILNKLFDQVKVTLQNLDRRDGEKDSPAKTCRELFATYPEKPTGV